MKNTQLFNDSRTKPFLQTLRDVEELLRNTEREWRLVKNSNPSERPSSSASSARAQGQAQELGNGDHALLGAAISQHSSVAQSNNLFRNFMLKNALKSGQEQNSSSARSNQYYSSAAINTPPLEDQIKENDTSMVLPDMILSDISPQPHRRKFKQLHLELEKGSKRLILGKGSSRSLLAINTVKRNSSQDKSVVSQGQREKQYLKKIQRKLLENKFQPSLSGHNSAASSSAAKLSSMLQLSKQHSPMASSTGYQDHHLEYEQERTGQWQQKSSGAAIRPSSKDAPLKRAKNQKRFSLHLAQSESILKSSMHEESLKTNQWPSQTSIQVVSQIIPVPEFTSQRGILLRDIEVRTPLSLKQIEGSGQGVDSRKQQQFPKQKFQRLLSLHPDIASAQIDSEKIIVQKSSQSAAKLDNKNFTSAVQSWRQVPLVKYWQIALKRLPAMIVQQQQLKQILHPPKKRRLLPQKQPRLASLDSQTEHLKLKDDIFSLQDDFKFKKLQEEPFKGKFFEASANTKSRPQIVELNGVRYAVTADAVQELDEIIDYVRKKMETDVQIQELIQLANFEDEADFFQFCEEYLRFVLSRPIDVTPPESNKSFLKYCLPETLYETFQEHTIAALHKLRHSALAINDYKQLLRLYEPFVTENASVLQELGGRELCRNITHQIVKKFVKSPQVQQTLIARLDVVDAHNYQRDMQEAIIQLLDCTAKNRAMEDEDFQTLNTSRSGKLNEEQVYQRILKINFSCDFTHHHLFMLKYITYEVLSTLCVHIRTVTKIMCLLEGMRVWLCPVGKFIAVFEEHKHLAERFQANVTTGLPHLQDMLIPSKGVSRELLKSFVFNTLFQDFSLYDFARLCTDLKATTNTLPLDTQDIENLKICLAQTLLQNKLDLGFIRDCLIRAEKLKQKAAILTPTYLQRLRTLKGVTNVVNQLVDECAVLSAQETHNQALRTFLRSLTVSSMHLQSQTQGTPAPLLWLECVLFLYCSPESIYSSQDLRAAVEMGQAPLPFLSTLRQVCQKERYPNSNNRLLMPPEFYFALEQELVFHAY